jgi:fucose permease
MFAVLMGVSRLLYGKYGAKWDLNRYMIGSGALCVACYLLASLSGNPILGLVGCAVCGFSVGIMWPGTISVSAQTLTTGGTAMFALLALGGDLGGSIGPSLVGAVSQAAGDNLKVGLLAGIVFPLILLAGLIALGRRKQAGKN